MYIKEKSNKCSRYFYENILFFFDFIYFKNVKFNFEKSDKFPLKTIIRTYNF